MIPVHAFFFGGPLHGERHVVGAEVITSVVTTVDRDTPKTLGEARVKLREVAYRRVERDHKYGGAIYNPPGDLVPYVFEDWLP